MYCKPISMPFQWTLGNQLGLLDWQAHCLTVQRISCLHRKPHTYSNIPNCSIIYSSANVPNRPLVHYTYRRKCNRGSRWYSNCRHCTIKLLNKDRDRILGQPLTICISVPPP